MSRRKSAVKREILPDVKYNDKVVAKLINYIMKEGKKSLARTIVYKAFDLINKKTGQEPLEIFKKAIENAKPRLEVKARRVGGSNYQVPIQIRSTRQLSLVLKWLIFYARARHEKTMIEKLSYELIDASNNTGATIKKKEDLYKMAEANKVFAHFRW